MWLIFLYPLFWIILFSSIRHKQDCKLFCAIILLYLLSSLASCYLVYYDPDYMDKQLDFFVKQLDVAVLLKRIVFLHCVGAWDKILHILKQYKQSELPVIVAHNFNENQDIIDKLLKYENIMFSIGKNAVYGKNCRIDKIPLERIFVETDGKPDVMLKDVISKIVDVKHDENVPNIIYNNTQRILKK